MAIIFLRCVLFCCLPTVVSSFLIPEPFQVTSRWTHQVVLHSTNTNTPPPQKRASLMERSRPNRRDVFSYDLWVEKRSRERFSDSLAQMFSESVVVRHLFLDYMVVTLLAAAICAFNSVLILGYDDLSMVHHDPIMAWGPILKLPGTFFSLTTPFLALLLVFKINTSYKRWDEGRKDWGAIVNSCRTIMREGAAWLEKADIPDAEQQRLMERLEQAVWCFPRSLTRHFLSADEDDDAYAVECHKKLRPDLAVDLIAARHKPTRALYELSAAINEFPIDERRRISMDASVTVLCNSMGSAERVFTSPIPKFYSRHTARFAECWLLCVPFGLYDTFASTWNHCGMIPTTFIITFFILTIEELSVQLEEPFTLLPQHAITENSIGKVATESVQWRKTDYERMLDAYQAGSAQP